MEIKTIQNVEVTITTGNKPQLPEKVEIELDNGITADIDVLWDPVNSDQFKRPGTFTIEGKVEFKDYPSPLIEQRADPYI